MPERWRSRLQPLTSGHVNSPSQKGHNRRIARQVFSCLVQGEGEGKTSKKP